MGAGDPTVGIEIAGYRIEGLLGRGGMSVVYLAEDLSLGRLVALKVLAPELASDDRFRERFVRESRLAAALEHPNIIPIFEAKEAQGRLYIAMRYVQGTDLRALLERQGRLSSTRTLRILSQVAGALDAAHERGLVHRDVKPGNVLIAAGSGSEGEDHVYLSDFGLTKRALSDSGVTATGQFVGTFDYAAPEQFEGRPLDSRTDVYSLGCVLYECLTGELPFPRDQEAAAMYAHLMNPPPRVTDIQAELPKEIDAVVAKAMAKAPDDRYATCGELIRAASKAFEVPGLDQPAPQPVEAPPGGPPEPGRSWPALIRQPVAVLVGLALLGVVVGLLFLLLPAVGSKKTVTGGPSSLADRLVKYNPTTQAVSAAVDPGGAPSEMTVGAGAVWVAHTEGPDRSTISKIDPQAEEAGKRVVLPFYVDDLAVGGIAGQEALWTSHDDRTITRLDPDTGNHVASIDFGETSEGRGSGPGALAIGEGAVWVCLFEQGAVARIDPDTNRIEATIDVGEQPAAITIGGGSVWVVNFVDATVSRIEPTTDRVVQTIDVGAQPTDVEFGEGAVWVVNNLDDSVARIDPSTGAVTDTISVGGRRPLTVAIGEGALWVVNYFDNSISIIIPATRTLAKTFVAAKVGESINDIVFGYGSFWVTIDAPD
jgi:serine/threonine-protein kinase